MVRERYTRIPIEQCRRQNFAVNAGRYHCQRCREGNGGGEKRQPALCRPRQNPAEDDFQKGAAKQNAGWYENGVYHGLYLIRRRAAGRSRQCHWAPMAF